MVEQNKSGFLNNYIVKKEIMEDIFFRIPKIDVLIQDLD